jgi:ankyrin repeat protein
MLDKGANVNAQDDYGHTALSFAASSGPVSGPVKNPEVLNLLREKGAK